MIPNDVSEVVPYLSSSATIVYVQRYLKSKQFYKNIVAEIPLADRYIHRAIAVTGALITAIGIHITFTGSILKGYDGTFHIPNLWDLLHGLGDFFKVFILQQTIYDATKDPVLAVINPAITVVKEKDGDKK